MAESSTKKIYPHKEEDITYEKEIVDAIKKLPLEQRILAVALNFYQLEKKRLDDVVDSEIDEIVKKYNTLQAPVAGRANQLIAGEDVPNDEEKSKMEEHLSDEEKSNMSANLIKEAIPDYWFKVLTTCERLSQDIFETDHPLLKKISKIEHIPSADNENFEIKFHFFANDYIENETLSVKWTMLEDGQEPEKSEATEIKWKEGKDMTKKTVTKKQKNKKTGKTRTVEKVVDAESFFNFFKSVSPKDEGDNEDEEGGDEDLERLNINFDIATTLQEEIVPYHLEYYLGLRKGDDYGALGGEEGDDDDDLGDDDDDEPEEKPAKKGKGGKGAQGAAAGGKPGEKPECKQQ